MTQPVVVFPDATAIVIAQLGADLAPVHVSRDIPNPRPSRFVTVRRGGGVRDSYVIDRPLVLIEAWDDDPYAAASLAQQARARIWAMRGTVADGGVAIYRVDDVGGPVDLPDPLSNQPRVTFTVQLRLRGAAI